MFLGDFSSVVLFKPLGLFGRWDVDVSTDCCSEKVGIIFSALHSTICEIGDEAFKWQTRSVTRDITDIVRLFTFFITNRDIALYDIHIA